jgi:hypothetical protein
MESVNDTHYKQNAVIELLVANKESVGNIHKRLCNVQGSAMVNRSTNGHPAKKWWLPKQEKQSSMICLTEAILSHLLALRCYIVLMPSFVRINASQPNNRHSNFQSAKEVSVTSSVISDIQTCE